MAVTSDGFDDMGTEGIKLEPLGYSVKSLGRIAANQKEARPLLPKNA